MGEAGALTLRSFSQVFLVAAEGAFRPDPECGRSTPRMNGGISKPFEGKAADAKKAQCHDIDGSDFASADRVHACEKLPVTIGLVITISPRAMTIAVVVSEADILEDHRVCRRERHEGHPDRYSAADWFADKAFGR